MKVLFGFLLSVGLLTCGDDSSLDKVSPTCDYRATVLSPLDGCGMLLQLEDGRLLMPLRLTYVQAPTPEDDPIYHYELRPGEKLIVGYREVEQHDVTACMAGEFVAFVTCIRPADEK